MSTIEVGEALNSQAVHIENANRRILAFFQDTSEKITNTNSNLEAIRLEVQTIKKQEEKHKVGLNECKAQSEKFEDSIGQLEQKVGEVAEGNRVLGQQVQEVKALQQELQEKIEAGSRALQEFGGRLEEKINCLLHPVTFSAPVYCMSGVPVVAEDTSGNLPSWGGGGDQAIAGFHPRTPGSEARVLTGQQGELSPGRSSVNTPISVPTAPDTPRESRQQGTQLTERENQVRGQQGWGEQGPPNPHRQGLEGVQQLPGLQHQEELGQASQPLKEAEAGNELIASAQQDFKTRESATQVTTNPLGDLRDLI